MPKLKTNKAAAKRLRCTKKGRVKRFKSGRRHLLAWKRSKKKRLTRKARLIAKVDEKTVKMLLPYGR